MERANTNRCKRSPTILIVDRSKEVQIDLKKDVISLGYNALSVGTWEEAVWLIRDAAVSVDAVFMNPFQDGREHSLVEFLAGEFPKIDVFFFVENEWKNKDELKRCSSCSSGVFFKPWTRASVEQAVKTLKRCH